MKPTRNTLPLKTQTEAAELLNGTGVDLLDLYARSKQARWNLRGESLFSVSSYTMGGFIHILLVIAIGMILLRLIHGGSPVK